MKPRIWFTGPVALAGFLVALLCRTAYGYIDLGTGSYLLQLLIAGILAALFAAKVYWAKFKTFVATLLVRRKSHKEGTDA